MEGPESKHFTLSAQWKTSFADISNNFWRQIFHYWICCHIMVLYKYVFFLYGCRTERWDITNICNFQRKHPPNIGKSRHILTNHSSTENPQDISRQSHLFPSFVRFCAKFSWQLIWVNVTNAFPRTANWICKSMKNICHFSLRFVQNCTNEAGQMGLSGNILRIFWGGMICQDMAGFFQY